VVVAVALGILAFLALSWNDEHYWDEYFYLYSARFHSPAELVRFEVVTRLFPVGFFSEKLGHVLLLSGLTSLLTGGVEALRAIQAAYTLLLTGFFGAAYACLRELFGPSRARSTTLVLTFSPLALYLAGKTLSEVPSLLLTTIGCWAFVRSFRIDSRSGPGAWLVLAGVTVGAGTLCRITGIVSFAALGLALLATGDPRFVRGRLLGRLVVVGIGAVALQAAAVALAGGSDLRFGSHVYNVVATHPAAQHVYAVALFVQGFALLLPFAWGSRADNETRLGVVWLAAAALPFLAGHEPRYYAPALLPFAIVGAVGLRGAGDVLFGTSARTGTLILLAGLVLLNRLLLAPLMPFEVQQSQLLGLLEALNARHPHGTYLLPWVSDYSLLRFTFPGRPIELSLSRTPESRYPGSDGVGPIIEADQWWTGRGHYVASRSDLERRPQPWLYIGWTYNPAALRIEKVLDGLGLKQPSGVGARQLHNHLAASWVWYDSSLTLTPTDSLGQYRAYRLSPQTLPAPSDAAREPRRFRRTTSEP
jgi:hypothetical protein